MPIQPMDMQVLVGRATEVDRLQQTRDAAQVSQQQALGVQARVETEHRKAQVRGTPHSEHGRVQRREDALDEKRGRQRRSKGQAGRRSGTAGGRDGVGSHIDIKL